MNRKHSIALLALCAATLLSGAARAQSYSYTAINAPNSTYTVPRGINNSGVVVGFSSPTDSFSEAGGVFTNIDVAGATRTRARGINDAGAVVGISNSPSVSGAQAYVQSSGGSTAFSFPGADATQGIGINNAGSIVGGYVVGGVSHAFQDIGGTASEISVPGSTSTLATGINNSGVVVGYYQNSSGNDQGFLYHNNTVTTLSVPGAAVTEPLGINNAGEIVGDYIPTAGGNELPFAKIGNLYVLLNVPQSIFANPTVTDATGVNDAGVIVGYTGLSSGTTLSGFRATPIAGAPLDIALAGGDASAPVVLPLSQISSISGAIGGGVSSQFYSFAWTGGAFGATLSLTGADPSMTYEFELCSGSSCGTILDSTEINASNWTGTLDDTLAAGPYTIGLIENQTGTDPDFTLSFITAVSSVPEPGVWTLLLLGFAGLGGMLRSRRRQAASVA
jgi:probable HAF family extracellular repeat protein